MNQSEAVSRYFRNIWEGVSTAIDGLSVTLTHLVRRQPITIQYPDRIPKPVQETLPPRYRGHLVLDPNACVSCKACAAACPIGCIIIEDVKVEKATVPAPDGGKPVVKTRAAYRFDVNLGRCMYCGLCVEVCPTSGLHHSREFEGASYEFEGLVRRFVTPEESERVKEMGRQFEEAQRAAAAKAAAEKTAKAAAATAAPEAAKPETKPDPS